MFRPWAMIVIGVWVLLSPWFLGVAGVAVIMWSNLFAGLVLVIVNLWYIFGTAREAKMTFADETRGEKVGGNGKEKQTNGQR